MNIGNRFKFWTKGNSNECSELNAAGVYFQSSNGAGGAYPAFNPSQNFILGNCNWKPYTNLFTESAGWFTYDYDNRGMRVTGSNALFIRNCTPIDPQATYRVSIRVKKIQNDTGGGADSLYCGVVTLDSNFGGVATDAINSYNYGVASSVSLREATGVATYTGDFTGYNAPGGSSLNKFDPYGSFFNIVIICNYHGVNNNGITVIESVKMNVL